jgi:hypothetical protein
MAGANTITAAHTIATGALSTTTAILVRGASVATATIDMGPPITGIVAVGQPKPPLELLNHNSALL